MKKSKKRIIHTTGFAVLFFGILLLCLGYYFTVKLQPVIFELSQAYAKNAVSDIINSETKKIILKEMFAYNDIVTVGRDKEGRVTSIASNTVLMNKLTNELGIKIGEELDKLSVVKNYIPLTSVFGADIFAGIGPKIPIRICPVSVANTELKNKFENAGINQTLHTISLSINVEVIVLLPFSRNNLKVDSSIPIAQTLIVGTVPNGYFEKK